ncbi:hypothetical protein KC363_g8291 [Hortaea werneckii]|nr:hypothetical protein KC359_g5161 [Hortaea werneckii]KAI7141118.1 hypothetical protein KC344_g8223 [Hortaea werneckii]KAI7168095.1 hypothetical protein KC360_g8249 [Hortaea werneckii]KAI7183333.1 hypothetical protein KC363_g8291 [Hortaea werneckii]KAI7508237.1 hypothetical protein KC347_g6259 [Hortaea werneckii]
MEHMNHGMPWLDQPVRFHSSREYTCKLNFTDQCEYQQGYWRFWYEADHRYALPTIAFFMAAIVLFSIGNLVQEASPRRLLHSRPTRKLIALHRYLSYRTLRIEFLNWNSAPLGILLLAAIGIIYFFCMTLAPKPYYWPNTHELNYGNSPPLATRAGWLSLACMPFVFATAGKSNFITLLTGVSHARLQVFHRWISYAFFILALMHTFPFIVYHIWQGDMKEEWDSSVFYWTGVIALLAQAYLTFASFGPLRNWCYEWFKFSHFVAVLVFMLFLFFHCDGTLSSWDYFVATGTLFALSWLHRQTRILFEHGFRHHATLNLAANGFVQVTVPTTATWTVGQHYFVRFMSMGPHMLTNHPFSACSLPKRRFPGAERESSLVFYIRPRAGFTARLARHTESHPDVKVPVLLDGPYGGVDMRQLESPDRLVVFAGGSGAGWVLPFVTAFIRRMEKTDSGHVTPSMRIVFVTRDLATQRWFELALSELLSDREGIRSHLAIELYYTGFNADKGSSSRDGQFLRKLDDPEKVPNQVSSIDADLDPKPRAEELKGMCGDCKRLDIWPDLRCMVSEEAAALHPSSTLGVFVCGPLSMQNDVANAVAKEQVVALGQEPKDIYLHMEHFSWA